MTASAREMSAWAAGLGAVLALAVVAVAVGAATVPVGEVLASLLGFGVADPMARAVVVSIRLPRVILALGVGATLGGLGAAIQGAVRNPLADPGLLGVTSGAALGAAVAITAGVGGALGLSAAAFLGALAATALAAYLGRADGYGMRLLLGGIAVNALAGAGIGLALFLADDARVRSFTFWTLGSLAVADWPTVAVAGGGGFLALGAVLRRAPALDALGLGARDAAQLGVDVAGLRRDVAIWTALGVGACVAATGGIGFVGLVVPHLVRGLTGYRHARLVPASALVGAGLLLAADLISRTIAAPAELPVGVVTGALGAPAFAWLVARGER